MLKSKRLFIVVFLFGFSTSLALAKEYQCKAEKRFKEGGSTGAKIELGVTRGEINKLIIDTFIASGEEGGGYMCSIDTSDKEQAVKWSILNNKTILNISESIIQIERIGKMYKISLDGASREGCGFGAEWPEYVVIEPGNSKCRIKN